MSSPGDPFRKKVVDWLYDRTATQIGVFITAFVAAAAGGTWAAANKYLNPTFVYTARPSSSQSHFVSIAQALNQIERDSHFACTGGWKQIAGALALRKCYKVTFVPLSVYRITACTRDQRTHESDTPDQLAALRHFQDRFPPHECYRIVSGNTENVYQIVPGKDLQFRKVQFGNDSPQEEGFCGCTDAEIPDIVRTMGGKLS